MFIIYPPFVILVVIGISVYECGLLIKEKSTFVTLKKRQRSGGGFRLLVLFQNRLQEEANTTLNCLKEPIPL